MNSAYAGSHTGLARHRADACRPFRLLLCNILHRTQCEPPKKCASVDATSWTRWQSMSHRAVSRGSSPMNASFDKQSSSTAGNAMVYVVDDEESVRESLGHLLRSAGYNVETFSSAEDFLAFEKIDRVA